MGVVDFPLRASIDGGCEMMQPESFVIQRCLFSKRLEGGVLPTVLGIFGNAKA
jgi:hypothetical protein